MESQEVPTDMDCQRVIHLVYVFCIFLLNHHMGRDDFAEVIQKQTGKDFLLDILHLFGVQATQANGIFQFAERRFDSLTHPVECFEFIRRKLISGKISDHAFIGTCREQKTHDS